MTRPRRSRRPGNPPRSAAAGGPPCRHRGAPPRSPPGAGSAGAGRGTAGRAGRRARASRRRDARSARGVPAGGRRRRGAGGAARASDGPQRRRSRTVCRASGRARLKPMSARELRNTAIDEPSMGIAVAERQRVFVGPEGPDAIDGMAQERETEVVTRLRVRGEDLLQRPVLRTSLAPGSTARRVAMMLREAALSGCISRDKRYCR